MTSEEKEHALIVVSEKESVTQDARVLVIGRCKWKLSKDTNFEPSNFELQTSLISKENVLEEL